MAAKTKATTPDKKPVRLIKAVCVGVHEGSKVKRVIGFRLLDDEGRLTEETMWFDPRSTGLGMGSVGSVYEIPDMGESKYRLSGRTFVEDWKDEAQVDQWDAEQKALMRDLDGRDEEERRKNRDHMAERLEPIARAYQRLNGPQRAQLVARVVYLVTKGAGR